jgi:uncharacterized protein (DUF4415 family)
MRKEYDLSKMDSRPNPYIKRLRKPVTLRLNADVIEYFKEMSKEVDIPYQSLINFYLMDCMRSHRKIKFV